MHSLTLTYTNTHSRTLTHFVIFSHPENLEAETKNSEKFQQLTTQLKTLRSDVANTHTAHTPHVMRKDSYTYADSYIRAYFTHFAHTPTYIHTHIRAQSFSAGKMQPLKNKRS